MRFSRFTVPMAVSPDGQLLAYVAENIEGDSQIYLRRLSGAFEPTPVPGTERAEMPFFSPDSTWLGFHVASELRKVPVSGGVPVKIGEGGMGEVSRAPDTKLALRAKLTKMVP